MNFNSKLLSNPFVVESPEKLELDQIAKLFVPEYSQVEIIKQRKHNFIWGSRGSGKSMLLRYLEPQSQFIAENSMKEFLNREDSFIGIYCPCKEGYFNKTELGLLDLYTSKIITEHKLNLYIAGKTIDCLQQQFPSGHFNSEKMIEFSKRVMHLFDSASIAPSIKEADELDNREDDPLKWLQALFYLEDRNINTFLRKYASHRGSIFYEGCSTGYHDFLLPFCKLVQDFGGFNSKPLFVMIDDGDRLTRDQQLIINTWIGNRDQKHLCIKVTAEFYNYKTFRKMDELFSSISEGDSDLLMERGGFIEAPHDYTDVNIEELYTANKTDYQKKIKLIADLRLKLIGLEGITIEKYLPPDVKEAKLLEDIKKKTADEWEKIGKPGERNDFINRYAMPRLFQHLKKKGHRKNYAGFNNMVHLSSGIVRGFLEPCFLMFAKCKAKQKKDEPVSLIPSAIQNEILFNYSEEFLLIGFEKIRKDIVPEQYTILESLEVLIMSLGRLFFEKLHDPKAREARLFSFSVRGNLEKEVENTLRLGLKHRYFHLRTYSTKEGGGREKWYILNRRLCPIFKLDPTGFEGRISLTAAALSYAISDPNKFVRLRLKQDSDEDGQIPMFSLIEEEAHD